MKITKTDISKILIIVGIWLRGRGLATALWYDEAFSVSMAKLPLPYLLKATWLDFTPALHYLMIKPFIWLAGSPWLARIPSLLVSILALAVLWEMMDDWQITENQRLWISALTLIPGFYWMAQDARVYATLGLLYLLSFWLMMGGQYKWAAVTMGMMIWGHAVGVVLVISIVVVNLLRDWLLQGMLDIRDIYKETARKTLLSGLAGMVVGIPALLPIMLGPEADRYLMMAINGKQIINSVNTALFVGIDLGEYQPIVFAVMWIYVVLAGMITLTALYHWGLILKNRDLKFIIEDDIVVTNALLVLVPFLLLLIVSVLIKPVLFYRSLMPLLYPFIMWIGSATAMQEYKPIKLVLPALLAACLIWAQINWSPELKGSDIERYAERINQDKGSEILYVTGTAALPFQLYVDQQGWIAEDEHHTNLGSNELMEIFGQQFREPGIWADWIIWPQEPLISDDLFQQLEELTAEYELVGTVEYWQIGDTEIWHREAGQ